MQRERTHRMACLFSPEEYGRLRRLGRMVARHGDMETSIRRFSDYYLERERMALEGDGALMFWDGLEAGPL